MTLVKPPSFSELVRTYGSPKAAVLHLLESSIGPEEISWKMGVPYYLIRLYMRGIEPKKTMLFANIARFYDRLAVLRSKRGKETALANLFKREDLDIEVKTRLALGKMSDGSLRIGPGVIERAISSSTGASPKKVKSLLVDYGEYGEVISLLSQPKDAKLTLKEVYEAIRLLPALESTKERDYLISSILDAATPLEAKYVVRLLLFDLKLGYNERTVIHAAARAYSVPPELIENVCSIIGVTEGIMLAPRGKLVLEKVRLRPGQFLKPQLAHIYEPEKVAYPTFAEHKIDGVRLQIHKWGTRIWSYSRQGLEKTEVYPEVRQIATKFRAQSCIVDCEIVATDSEGQLLPFQTLLKRTGTKQPSSKELQQPMEETTVTIRAFDLLYQGGRELTEAPLSERRKFLLKVVPEQYLVGGKLCRNEIELMSFYEDALKQGSEGVIVKALNSPYEIGQRTHSWLKLKPERDTIDCTFVKALHGRGRRTGFYSSFLMAIRDPTEKKLYTIGKVSNLSERLMEHLKSVVERTQTGSDEEGVFITPSLVVEVTYQEVQTSDDYTSGYALRVPKVIRFNQEKSIDEIDSLKKLKKLYEIQYEREAPETE